MSRVTPEVPAMSPASGVPAPAVGAPPPLSGADSAATRFLDEFRARHGRAPRVLHIGNIANNAYLNAKFLNAAGYDCDVICYDYYHLMGCPEWEDADFEGEITDQFSPDWSAVDLRGFERPRWFVQGPQHLCIDYLIARRGGEASTAARLWEELGFANRTLKTTGGTRAVRRRMSARLRQWAALIRRYVTTIRNWPNAPHRLWSKLEVWALRRGAVGWFAAACAVPFLMSAVLLIRFVFRLDLLLAGGWSEAGGADSPGGSATLPPLERRFSEVFPDRVDQMTPEDYAGYVGVVGKWRELFSHYDIVQAYATDVAYPLLAEKRPYLGFEHGTLRDFTLAPTATCRLTALGYQQADHVFITNGDCLDYARRIQVRSFTPMVHPVDDRRIRAVQGDYEGQHRAYGARRLFVCPLRHDWAVKGTDTYIRALPGIIERLGRDCRLVMTRWGAQLEASRELARSLGVDEFIAWVEPLHRGKLVALQKSADVVFDQIALPHFGATAPQAIAAGVPVIMSYNPNSTEWIIPEPAPILSAWTPEDVVEAVATALDPAWRADYARRAPAWFDTYHRSDHAVERMAEAYHRVCTRAGVL